LKHPALYLHSTIDWGILFWQTRAHTILSHMSTWDSLIWHPATPIPLLYKSFSTLWIRWFGSCQRNSLLPLYYRLWFYAVRWSCCLPFQEMHQPVTITSSTFHRGWAHCCHLCCQSGLLPPILGASHCPRLL
jgi:hypothetical protein